MTVDRPAAAQAIEAFLRAIGLDPKREAELAQTGARVANAYADEICDGYGVDVGALLKGAILVAPAGSTEIVTMRDVPVTTMCPHHLMPGWGTATVAFAPASKLLGFGSIVQLVDAYAH